MKSLFKTYYSLCSESLAESALSLGLLLLRVFIGGFMLTAHGWGKLMSYPEKYTQFPDPLGLGSPLSMTLAVGAEVFCAAALILGLAMRLAAVPLIITMLVAAFVVHGDDPWQKKEFALLYLIPFVVLAFTGPGRYSLDALLARWALNEEEGS